MGKYRPAVILTLALTVFLASCKGTSDDPVTPGPGPETKSWVVSTLAGGDVPGHQDATGTAAAFYKPHGVAVDSSGILYVAGAYDHRIRKITSAGVVTTIAGTATPGFADTDADGNPVVAQFDFPHGVAVDSSGILYVADSRNHRIRKITSEGVVTTLAGGVDTSGNGGYLDATGTNARFDFPSGVAVDSSGNLYVADTTNHRIRKITSEGVVTTLAGSGTYGHHDATGTAAQFKLSRIHISEPTRPY